VVDISQRWNVQRAVRVVQNRQGILSKTEALSSRTRPSALILDDATHEALARAYVRAVDRFGADG
jgi:hypothetical protein